MIDEQKPTLPPSDHGISAYARKLLARWRNREIAHQLERVARDASTKLATWLLGSLRDYWQPGAAAAGTSPAGLVNALLDRKDIFAEDLAEDRRLRRSLTKAVSVLQQRSAVLACVAGTLLDSD